MVDIFEEVFLVTLRMPHLAEDLAVTRHQALDGIRRTVGVVRRLGRRTPFGIDILEGHLPVGEQLPGKFFAHDELAFAVADSDRVDMREVFTIDGRRFSNMAGFYDEVEQVFTCGLDWKIGRNLDAFNDILRGGFGG